MMVSDYQNEVEASVDEAGNITPLPRREAKAS